MNRKLSKYLISLAAVCALIFIAFLSFKNKAAENNSPKDTQSVENIQNPGLIILDPDEEAPQDSQNQAQDPVAPEEAAESMDDAQAYQSIIDEDGTYTTKDEVALYIHTYGRLPKNYITKKQAEAEGWTSGDAVSSFAPGKCIGGDRFGNYEGLLPKKKGRTYTECDIDAYGRKSRGSRRIVFSNDGFIYYTGDHYKSFELLYAP